MRSRTLVAGIAAAAAATLLCIPGTALAATTTPPSPITSTTAQHVLVMLKDQPAAAKPGTAAAVARAKAIVAAQAPLLARIKADVSGLKTYTTSDMFAATLPSADVAVLQADPAVASVIPDSTIRVKTPAQPTAASDTASGLHSIPGACSTTPQLDEPATVLKADSDDPHAVTARSLGYTGAGVKVGWIADGIDTKNVNFLRDPSDPSSSIFSAYKDFSGDGPSAETAGGEAFLDANAIAGQGKHVYDVNAFGPTSDPATCNVRIEGIAPGASLVGLKVFSESGTTTTSNFLQAIDYAVQTAHVDVLNESFGGNPLPDVTTADAIKQFNDAAVAAGTTVTVSSGDAGPYNTNGSPSTDPKVIAVGATTTFRYYAQTGYAGARNFATSGWLDNNISGLSSSGVDENGGTLNVVAPGDLSWASCTPTSTYDDCVNYFGKPSELEDSGGTSESAPLTAGAAALVIQAYEKAHGGDSPSPALVKQIITSTATDLGGPAAEQGAGLVDTAKAVQQAASVSSGTAQGDTLLKSVDEVSATGTPGSAKTFSVDLTNTGTRTQHVAVSGRTLGTEHVVQKGSVTLSDATSAKFTDYLGRTNNYQKITFSIPPGQDRLTAEYAYQGDQSGSLNPRVRLDLIDPSGKLAAHSIPQGVGNHDFIDVLHPTAGSWTGYLFSPTSALDGTVGAVPYQIATEQNVSFGSVSPGTVTLQPGASTSVALTTRTPSSPGDAAGAIVIASDLAGTGSVPVALRSTVDVAGGGRFNGTLTGGNGRQTPGQQAYFRFAVPAGTAGITADLALSSEPQNAVGLYLVSPHGDTVGYGQNTAGGKPSLAATAWTLKPTAGLWTLVVAFASPTAGDLLRIPFSGSIAFNTAKATATGLPNSSSTNLSAGTAVTVPVKVTNNGTAPAQFFVDARLSGSTVLPLTGLAPTTNVHVPVVDSEPDWFVPTETTRVAVAATAGLPIEFDLTSYSGDPDVTSHGPDGGSLCARAEAATYGTTDRTVSSGLWFAVPSECGPYTGPAPTTTADFVAAAVTRPFDRTVTSAPGDAELYGVDASTEVDPVVIAPGTSATIQVKITPNGKSGTTVRGDLFVDTLQDDVPPYGAFAADEVTSVPYSYTIR